jgi:hypothetical protein
MEPKLQKVVLVELPVKMQEISISTINVYSHQTVKCNSISSPSLGFINKEHGSTELDYNYHTNMY